MIADVMIDKDLPDWGLSISEWNEALEEIIEDLYPELINEHVKVRFTEEHFLSLGLFTKIDGAFDPPTQSLFINSFWMDKEGITPLECIAKVLTHELKHYVQCVQGYLDLEKANSYIIANPLTDHDELPWEVEAITFESRHHLTVFKIIISHKKRF